MILNEYTVPDFRNINLEDVGVKLMQAHVTVVSGDKSGIHHYLSAEQVAIYHHVVFGKYGLPPNTFGGTTTGNLWETNITRFIWCGQCDIQ